MQRRSTTTTARRIHKSQRKVEIIATQRPQTPLEQQRMMAAIDAFLTELARQEIARMRRQHE